MVPFVLHPAYFPSVASFGAITQAQTLWFEAADNYQKQTYRNRLYLYASNGRQTLTVPVKHTHDTGRQKYKDVQIENDFDWKKQHWRTLQTAYRTSPFFEFYEDDIAPLFHTTHTSLFELNMKSIELICECIQYDLSYKLTKNYQKEYHPKARDYRSLVNAKVSVPFEVKSYKQVFDDKYGHLKNLSILDLLFNEGPQTIDFLQQIKLP